MIPATRRSFILDLVKKHGAVSIPELEEALKVSPATIRRDLDMLSRQSYLRRSHGGAVVQEAPTTAEPHHSLQALSMRAEKRRIGLSAATLAQDGQSLILDSSSTVLELARALETGCRDLTIVTNDVAIAHALTDSRSVAALVVTGGTLRQGHYTLGGAAPAEMLAGLHVDVAFLGVHALDDEGASETNIEVARVKTLMARAARRVVVLADHSKFGLRSFTPIIALEEIDTVVTDDGVAPVVVARLRERGIDVMIG